ncbi:lytic polysaccharide monooxygenase auxiliary activity family 9 protein [Streptomyces johnsoniae]|uniref:Lytic polysaccharide monooxygenase n=2 Tax=Streptomyces TaxID=1883 RepID=A0ABU2SH30_9ACTN|nr:lytic polysaccharide monooxygenase [Streptomyces sp. DSM 41886]MDT0447194.1 lytic polysaccharide monooxygenase [Streptomyces sp. DSM 41886]
MRDRAESRAWLRRTGLLTALAALPAMATVVFTGGTASAHGAPMDPGSRTYLCWKYSLDSTGAVNPTNPACQAALEAGGANAFYNWFSVLQSNGGGRTEGFIPDGQLCSGAATVNDFSGFDLPHADWPYTNVTAGDTYEFTYNPWAHHPGTFHQYVTEDSWDPTQPLTWADIEDEPFHSETDPPYRGNVGNAESEYYWESQLPTGKTGRHIIYTVWERSDSQETFYSCADVDFNGGNGEVTVPGVTDAGIAESEAAAEAFESENAPHVSEELSTHTGHDAHAGHGAPGEVSPVVASVVRSVNGLLLG